MAIIQGQKVLTHQGLKYIHEVDMGDFVLNDEGKWSEVVGMGKRKVPIGSPIVREQEAIIDIDGEYEPLHITSDQQVLVKRKHGIDLVPIYELQEGDFIASPRVRSPGTKGANINLDMAWFFGMYCGKGGIVRNENGQYILVRFNGSTPQDQVQRFCQISGNLGASKVDASFDQTYQMFVVKIYGDALIDVVKQLFHPAGHNVPHTLPIEFHSWTLDQKTQLFIGFLSSFPERMDNGSQSWLCSSPDLSYHFCFIASSMGITIDHNPDLWDYAGKLDPQRETFRDEEFIYRKVISIRSGELAVPKMAYSLQVDDSSTLCLGLSLIHGAV